MSANRYYSKDNEREGLVTPAKLEKLASDGWPSGKNDQRIRTNCLSRVWRTAAERAHYASARIVAQRRFPRCAASCRSLLPEVSDMFQKLVRCSSIAALMLWSLASALAQSPAEDIALRERIDEVTREIERHPGDVSLLARRAELYQSGGRWELMKSDLDRVIAVRPRDAKALALRGLASGAAGDSKRALADLDASLEIEPRNAFALGLRGNVLMHLGQLGDAIDSFGRSIAEKPLARVHFDRGFAHELNGDLQRAITDYSEAMRLDPELVDAACARGQACQQTGDFRGAVKDFDHCRKWKPDDPRATLALAWLLATCPDAAVRDGRKALVLATDLCDPILCSAPETLNALAAAYAELGEFGKAEALLERAVALSHFAPDFHEASSRRLQVIRGRQPIREATVPLGVLPRPMQEVPRTISPDEALAAPADVLGSQYLQARSIVTLCTIASAGATVDAVLDGLPLKITAANASRIRKSLDNRLAAFTRAIRQRGYARLAGGYRAEATGGCAEWGLDTRPVIIEQDGFDIQVSQGNVRHMGVVVESQVEFRHDMNTDITIGGRIDDSRIVFVTADRGGIAGAADQRCTLTLTPSEIAGADWAEAFAGRALAFQSYEEYGRMLADLERSLELRPDAQVYALLAYVLATCPDAKMRNGRRAVAAAEEARKLAVGKMDVMVHICLAVAHAEAGDFAEAAKHQRKVIDLVAGEEKLQQTERLRLFESGKPFHERRAVEP